jgi:dihydrofolate synthase/folylpolyglutamate synthase
MAMWRLEDAEQHLLSLELFGMRFGLDRMRRLLTVLGSPQERYPAIHVVGTNGKSSTVRMCAALLEAHGLRTGAFLSPHLTSFAERIRVADADLAPDAFGAAVQRAAAAAAKVDRTLEPGDRVTQFELVTAAALAELARQEVDVAVVEAGLGGRHDATNVLGAPVVVLTNVGLEHTRWLGPTVSDIAREKLAVVQPDATLVLGPVDPEVESLALQTGARIVRPAPLEALAGYQRTNFTVAAAAARAHLGELDPALVADVAGRVTVPGRMQVVAERPLTIYDGAHNPSGVEALAAALPEALGGRPLVAVVSILDDKDAAGMLRALVGKTFKAVFTSTTNPRALSPATLASLWTQVGGGVSEIAAEPHAAVARAQALAGPDGAVLATGSIYLVADLVAEPGRRRASAL